MMQRSSSQSLLAGGKDACTPQLETKHPGFGCDMLTPPKIEFEASGTHGCSKQPTLPTTPRSSVKKAYPGTPTRKAECLFSFQTSSPKFHRKSKESPIVASHTVSHSSQQDDIGVDFGFANSSHGEQTQSGASFESQHSTKQESGIVRGLAPDVFCSPKVACSPAATTTPEQATGIYLTTPPTGYKQSSLTTPPSGPGLWHRQLQSDVDEAIKRGSVPLLSLAFTRSHRCSEDHSIHEAVRNQHFRALQFLLSKSTLAQADAHCRGRRPLHECLTKRKTDCRMAEALLSFGVSANAMSGDLESLASPLHVASSVRSSDVVGLLLYHAADPNLRDGRGQSPLHVFCKNGKNDVAEQRKGIRLLLIHGANPTLVDELGFTPADYTRDAGLRNRLQLAARHWWRRELTLSLGCSSTKRLLPEITEAIFNFL